MDDTELIQPEARDNAKILLSTKKHIPDVGYWIGLY